MKTLQALIFDVDGTLADTERDGHRIAFNLAFAEHGLDWHWDEDLYGELLTVTGGKERIRYFVERHATDVASRPDFNALVAALHATKTEHYVRLVASGQLPLRPGVARLISEARASRPAPGDRHHDHAGKRRGAAARGHGARCNEHGSR